MDIYFGRERLYSIAIRINIRPDDSPGIRSFTGAADVTAEEAIARSSRRRRCLPADGDDTDAETEPGGGQPAGHH